MALLYQTIEEYATEALPELLPAARHYWAVEGGRGEDAGPYIFFSEVVSPFAEILLSMPSTPRRDALLLRLFGAFERMLGSEDRRVADLARDAVDGRPVWWYGRAEAYLGPNVRRYLDDYHCDWRASARARVDPTDGELADIIDLHGVRTVTESVLEP